MSNSRCNAPQKKSKNEYLLKNAEFQKCLRNEIIPVMIETLPKYGLGLLAENMKKNMNDPSNYCSVIKNALSNDDYSIGDVIKNDPAMLCDVFMGDGKGPPVDFAKLFCAIVEHMPHKLYQQMKHDKKQKLKNKTDDFESKSRETFCNGDEDDDKLEMMKNASNLFGMFGTVINKGVQIAAKRYNLQNRQDTSRVCVKDAVLTEFSAFMTPKEMEQQRKLWQKYN